MGVAILPSANLDGVLTGMLYFCLYQPPIQINQRRCNWHEIFSNTAGYDSYCHSQILLPYGCGPNLQYVGMCLIFVCF